MSLRSIGGGACRASRSGSERSGRFARALRRGADWLGAGPRFPWLKRRFAYHLTMRARNLIDRRLNRGLPKQAAASRPRELTTTSVASQALGALALGAVAIGALAVGALAIGRLTIGRARIRRLEIDELLVRRLRVIEELEAPPKPEPGD